MDKNLTFCICILLLVLSCKVQKDLGMSVQIGIDFIPGKCYSVSIDENQDFEQEFILEVIPPKFDTVSWKLNAKDMEVFKMDESKYYIRILDAYTHFKILNKNDIVDEKLTLDIYEKVLCKIENPPVYKVYHKSDLSKNDNTIHRIVLSKKAHIKKTLVTKKPKDLSANQLYFEKAKWSKLKVLDQGSH